MFNFMENKIQIVTMALENPLKSGADNVTSLIPYIQWLYNIY